MKRLTLLFALLLSAAAPLRAELFTTGQPADLFLGTMPSDRTLDTRLQGLAVDPVSKKVFVADTNADRILRFPSMAALQNGAVAEAELGERPGNPTLNGARLSLPSGLACDGAGRLWVADRGNNRVLRFDGAATLPSGAPASGVLGQANFTTSTAGTAENKLTSPSAVAVDSGGRLWVADLGNYRVLRFNNAATLPNGANAHGVLGQPDFVTSGGLVTASARTVGSPGVLAVDEHTSPPVLWVTDPFNNRVCGFRNPATAANYAPLDIVLGQPDAVTGTSATTRTGMSAPFAVACSGGTLWVSDKNNNRVLAFFNARGKANGAQADLVLGQSLFTTNTAGSGPGGLDLPEALAVDGSRLWIGDKLNRRVIRHENAASKANGNDADGVIGKLSLTGTSGETPGTRLSSPLGIAIDATTGKVFVADRDYNRVLRFANSRALETGDEPEAVLGQDNFATTTAGTSATRMNRPTGLALDSAGRLWVADSRNNRILRFNSAPTLPSGAAASAVLGQPDFTSSTPGTSASTLDYPFSICIHQSFGSPTRLWVADFNNARVLRFDNPGTLANGAAATGVLGQANLTSNAVALNAQSMSQPNGVCVDFSGRLWVSDEGHDRVLRFDNAAVKANGVAADGVLLAPNFTTSGTQGNTPVGISLSLSGRLFVPLFSSSTVIWFDNAHTKASGAAADGTLGSQSGIAPDGPEVLVAPGGSTVDPGTNRLWVTHSGRVSRFTPSIESRITGAGFNAQGRFELQMLIRVDEKIELRSGTDLLSWPTLDASPANFSSATPFALQTWTAPAAPTGPERFYRLQLK